jgi:hypothetical protein
MRYLLLTLMLLLSSQGLAEVVAVIKAPTQVAPGDLVILDSSESKGDNQLWVVDPRAAGRYLELDKRIVFAIGTPGDYEFQLIVADKKAAIDQTKHTVRVGTSLPQPPTQPPAPPTDPVPPPSNKIVLEATQAATNAVNDPTTAAALRQALISLPEKTPEAVQKAIGDVLEKRTGNSVKVNWTDLWRVPVNKAIEDSKLPYPQAIEQVIQGLQVSTKSKITMYFREGCPDCDKWKEKDMPRLESANWDLALVEDLTQRVPYYDICINGSCVRHHGYLTMAALKTYSEQYK